MKNEKNYQNINYYFFINFFKNKLLIITLNIESHRRNVENHVFVVTCNVPLFTFQKI